jgi:ribosomal protein S30
VVRIGDTIRYRFEDRICIRAYANGSASAFVLRHRNYRLWHRLGYRLWLRQIRAQAHTMKNRLEPSLWRRFGPRIEARLRARLWHKLSPRLKNRIWYRNRRIGSKIWYLLESRLWYRLGYRLT